MKDRPVEARARRRTAPHRQPRHAQCRTCAAPQARPCPGWGAARRRNQESPARPGAAMRLPAPRPSVPSPTAGRRLPHRTENAPTVPRSPGSPDTRSVDQPAYALALGKRQATLGGARTLVGPGDSSRLIFSGETAAPPAPGEDLANARSSAWLRGHELGACPQGSTQITPICTVAALPQLRGRAAPNGGSGSPRLLRGLIPGTSIRFVRVRSYDRPGRLIVTVLPGTSV